MGKTRTFKVYYKTIGDFNKIVAKYKKPLPYIHIKEHMRTNFLSKLEFIMKQEHQSGWFRNVFGVWKNFL